MKRNGFRLTQRDLALFTQRDLVLLKQRDRALLFKHGCAWLLGALCFASTVHAAPPPETAPETVPETVLRSAPQTAAPPAPNAATSAGADEDTVYSLRDYENTPKEIRDYITDYAGEDGVQRSLEGPDVVITAGKSRTVYEYRQGGQLRLVKIIPRIGRPYYLVPADQTRGFGDLGQADMLLPQWTIVEF